MTDADKTESLLLRRERDRYAAFALAGADILLEIDSAGLICYASGKCREIFGRPAAAIEQSRFIDYIGGTDKRRIERAIKTLHGGEKLTWTRTELQGQSGAVKVLLSGFRVEGRKGHTYLALSLPSAGNSGAFEQEIPAHDEDLSELRKAISRHKFDLAFQPIVDLKTGKWHHNEVLLRFRSGKDTLQMIKLAEQAGLIADLDLSVIAAVLSIVRKNRRKSDFLPLAVNISGFSLQSRDFARRFTDALKTGGATPERLMIEVTETAEIVDRSFVKSLLKDLRGRGYCVCLDDFGSGAAVFDYLHDFEIDFIKIDGELTRLACTDSRERNFLTAISRLAKRLGVAIIAEQIETDRELEMLRAADIPYGQGYYFARPQRTLLSGTKR